ncbi:RebB family R body protein [Pseudogulbenkiania sp. MAI-1]|uniref:RebB family R body protein n=1 Tax=Pseudogulbenkiania sp. MAI-1 TaxID=990370 RepID=UPI00045EB100|nr:RebB family R body protein [Pseudogulbenkiania sp. MAI-1]
MAFPTPLNGQITDAVTQSNVKVIGEAPAMAAGTIYQSLAHSEGILMESAVESQQELSSEGEEVASQMVDSIYDADGGVPEQDES